MIVCTPILKLLENCLVFLKHCPLLLEQFLTLIGQYYYRFAVIEIQNERILNKFSNLEQVLCLTTLPSLISANLLDELPNADNIGVFFEKYVPFINSREKQ